MPRRILELLKQRSPYVVPRTNIETALRENTPPDSDALRLAIDPPGARRVRGAGYQLADGDAAA